jgi:hypothetical protein
MYLYGLYQYNMVHTGIYQDETYKWFIDWFIPGRERFKSSSYWYIRVNPRLTWFTPCWAVLVRVKAAESQRPKDTPMQAETIYYFSAGAALRLRPTEAAEAVVH